MTDLALYQAIDPVFIWAFRVPGNEYAGFALGLLWVALATTVVGELCMAGAYFINKRHFAKLSRDMVHNNNLSVQAIGMQDKASYKACNSLANEAFGKTFFAHIALFASSVWPAFFGLGWLDHRFGAVDFAVPLAGDVGPAFLFVPLYILVRIAFNKSKPWLPFFRTIKARIDENEYGEKMMSFADLMDKGAASGKQAGPSA